MCKSQDAMTLPLDSTQFFAADYPKGWPFPTERLATSTTASKKLCFIQEFVLGWRKGRWRSIARVAESISKPRSMSPGLEMLSNKRCIRDREPLNGVPQA